MSKKKNTLSDLEDFLKSQASSLVQPPAVQAAPLPSVVAQVQQTMPTPTEPQTKPEPQAERAGDFEGAFKTLFANDKAAWYRLVVHACEQEIHTNPKLALLINTALYVQHGPDWKTAIERYWNSKKNG